MKLIIKTETLKDMLSHAIKGASFNKMLPITSMVCLKVNNDVITLTTTNGSTYLVVKDKLEETTNFEVVMYADVLNKLVSKTTAPQMIFTLENDKLTIKGNGTYEVELPLTEEGKLVKFPNLDENVRAVQTYATVSEETLKDIQKTNKAALSQSLAEPCYTGYYVGDSIITSDGYKICCLDRNVTNTAILLPSEIIDLAYESFVLYKAIDSDAIMLEGSHFAIYSKLMDCIDKFKVADIMKLIDSELPYHCAFNKDTMLSVLDRLSLFVGPYDRNTITLHTTKDFIEVTNLHSTSTETVKYVAKDNIEDFTMSIDIELLKSQLSAQNFDDVDLYYGNDKFIKIVGNDTTQILALLGD